MSELGQDAARRIVQALSEDPQPQSFPTVFTMHTPSGPVHCCVRHARQVEGLMRVLGVHAMAVKAPDDAQCGNCINEAKRLPGGAP